MEADVSVLKMKIDSYNQGIKFLNECGTFTFDKLLEAHRIATSPVQEVKLRETWKVEPILGAESIRGGTVELFTKVITEFQRRIGLFQD